MKGKTPAPGIECFLWSKDGKLGDKLIYYDKNGQCIEKPVPTGLLDQGLKLFDNKPRTVRRSTGGWSLARPLQMVIYDSQILEKTGAGGNTNLESVIRIRVEIQELVKNREGMVISPQAVTLGKVVKLSEIRSATLPSESLPEKRLLDLGQGIIPVDVFHVEQSNTSNALFVLPTALEEVLKSTSKSSLQVLQAPFGCLRWGNETDLRMAQENLLKLAQKGELIIPSCLEVGSPIQIPGGVDPGLIYNYLRVSLRPEDRAYYEPVLIHIEKKDELLPFGLFEAP